MHGFEEQPKKAQSDYKFWSTQPVLRLGKVTYNMID